MFLIDFVSRRLSSPPIKACHLILKPDHAVSFLFWTLVKSMEILSKNH
jgi:hypothetical protein